MKKLVSVLLASVMVLGLAACARPVSAQELRSDRPRAVSSATESDLAELVRGNNEFAFDLYRVLSKEEGNLFYSPYSISEALAMVYAGAFGTTQEDMARALHFILTSDSLHAAFNSLDQMLKQRGQGAEGTDGAGFRLHVLNALWGQKDYPFLASFLDTLAENYGAGLRVLDFVGNTEQARQTINDWVSQQTEQKITDLMPPGAIDGLTRLVLTNAIYFNAAWEHPFEKNGTADGTFHLADGCDVLAPMMQQTASLGYGRGDGYEAVELPYDGGELSMVILVPDAGQFETFEGRLNADLLDSIITGLERQRIDLTMPKFQYDSSFSLKQALEALGMGVAFTGDADLSGMDGQRDLSIKDVLHKAFVSVDEAGTEAAAASGVIVQLTSMPLEALRVRIDRPFIYVIRDIATGSTLFVGRVMNPVAD